MITNIEPRLLEIVGNYLAEKNIITHKPLDTALNELTLDSLEQVELFMLVEQQWNIDIDVTNITAITSMRDLIPILEKASQECQI